LNPDYVISPFSEISLNNTPPVIRFEQNGPAIQGPIATLAGVGGGGFQCCWTTGLVKAAVKP
jgi:hypothetical protein